MNQTKNRMKQAELARAYMNGGTPPYQAARKCGFLRVALMEEAIRELEAHEKLENSPASDNDSAYLPKAEVVIDTRPPRVWRPVEPEERIAFKPLQVWKNNLASVAHYGQNDERKPMFRLRLEGVRSYIEIPETHIKDAAKMLCEAAGLNGPHETEGSNDPKILVGAEKEEESVLLAMIKDLEVALHAEKEAHNALKLKVFDKLFAQLQGGSST